MARLDAYAEREAWGDYATTFFCEVLLVPRQDVAALRETEHWPPILADARATVGDLRALFTYSIDLDRCRRLTMPVLLQTGTESPKQLYMTETLAAVLPDARIEGLPGQAHEAMTSAPDLYVRSVTGFLLDEGASMGPAASLAT